MPVMSWEGPRLSGIRLPVIRYGNGNNNKTQVNKSPYFPRSRQRVYSICIFKNNLLKFNGFVGWKTTGETINKFLGMATRIPKVSLELDWDQERQTWVSEGDKWASPGREGLLSGFGLEKLSCGGCLTLTTWFLSEPPVSLWSKTRA